MTPRTSTNTEVKNENTVLETAVVEIATTGYEAPRVITHSARKMDAAVLPVNACTSNLSP